MSRSQCRSHFNGSEKTSPKKKVIIERDLVERSFEIKKSEIIRVVLKPHRREREGVESKREQVWSQQEEEKLLRACRDFPGNWVKISNAVGKDRDTCKK